MNTDLTNVIPQSASIAIVSDDGTVFEAQGQVRARYATEQDTDGFFAGGPVPEYYVTLREPRRLCIYLEITDFEGSITVPPRMVHGRA